MATQTIEFRAPTGQTITAKLFPVGSDTQTASVSATEATNRKGTYSAAYTDVAAGTYDLIALAGSTPVAKWTTTLTLTTATFQARDLLPSEIRTEIDTNSTKLASILEDTGTTLPAQISGIGGGATLSGPYTRTITVTDSSTDAAIELAKVRLFRTGETETKQTNASGVVTFTTEAATWSYAVTAVGYGGATGTIAISGTGSTSVELTATTVTPSSNPDNSILVITCRTPSGVAESGVVISVRKKSVASGDVNNAYSGAVMTDTSGGDGVTSFEVVRNAVYQYKRGTADVWHDITIDDDSQTDVVSIVGSRY